MFLDDAGVHVKLAMAKLHVNIVVAIVRNSSNHVQRWLLLKPLIAKIGRKLKKSSSLPQAERITADQHQIDQSLISKAAMTVCQKLNKAGYDAYLVGGSVRDLLLGRKPKDFDIATNAKPEQVQRLFRHARIIGRRFKLVHVSFRREVIEVATYRASVDKASKKRQTTDDGMLVRDNVYGSLEEDAWRRDFTINAFYYNPDENVVLDFVGGIKDLKQQRIETIGQPLERYQEDPIRLIRAMRFAAKLQFQFSAEHLNIIKASHELLAPVPGSRLYDAFLQVFFAGYAEKMYHMMCEHGYFQRLFPETATLLEQEHYHRYNKLIERALRETDRRFAEGKSLNPGFLLAVFLWPTLQRSLYQYRKRGHKFYHALHCAIDEALKGHKGSLLVLPQRVVGMIRDVWLLQFYMKQRRPKRIMRIYNDRYFRAAFDFLEMRATMEEPLDKAVNWWKKFQHVNEQQQGKMIRALSER